MKKGHSYISLNDDSNHPLINALKRKGFKNIELIYASTFSPQCGWDMISSNKHLMGWDGWLGYTKKEALLRIQDIRIEDNFAYKD